MVEPIEPSIGRKRPRWGRRFFVGLIVAALLAVSIPVSLVLLSWGRVERVPFHPGAAREQLGTATTTAEGGPVLTDPAAPSSATAEFPDPPFNVTWVATTVTGAIHPAPPPVPVSPRIPDSAHQAILVVGSDRPIGATRRADVIMLALIPSDGSNPLLVSVPRDLYLDNPCGGGRERINAALNGCGAVSGPDLLAVAIEDFTGIPVDHYVVFDFDGFARVIDAAGGVEVCVDHPTFDTNTTPDLNLPAGCSTLDGRMALSWVRSRKTRQMVDGVERSVPGVGDHTRQARQRQVVLQMIQRLSGYSSPAQIVSLAQSLPGAFVLDSGLSLTGAVGIAWDLRGRAGSIRTPTIAVTSYTTADGAWVALPTRPFAETIGWGAG